MPFLSEKTYENILLFMGISVAAYCGAYIRVGIGYYEIWRIETNYCVMYTQMVGCFIMGFMLQHRNYLFVNSHCIALRVFYTAIASGLCGSITTFSSWSAECNKSFYLQWDLGWGNDQGSYNGGRFFEWITCMTAGIAIPMVALHFGQFCALATNYNEEAVKVYLANHTFVPSRAASRAVSRANSFRDNKSPPLSPALSPNMSRSLDPLSGKMSPTAASDALALKRKLSLDANKGPNFSSVKALTAESFQLPTEEIGVSPTVATADAKDPVNDDSATKITPNDEVPVNQVGREASLSYDEAGIAGTWTDSFGAYDLEKILEGALEDESEHRPERSVSVSYEPYQESNRASSRDSIVIPSTSPPLLIRGSVKSDNTRVVQYFVMQELWWAELIIVIIFVVATALVVVLPTVLNDHSYIFLTYTAVLGAAGAYLRYRFSLLNSLYPFFPIGTFLANILGTWLLAGFTSISKYSIDFSDVNSQALMFALITGFCGCLTTISTLVSEIDKLPSKHSYTYAITTNLVAQLGLVLFLNVPSVVTIPSGIMASTSINYCQASSQLCATFLDNIACPTALKVNLVCSSPNTFNGIGEAYGSVCECGSFNTTRPVRRLVGSLAGSNSTSFKSAWPRDASSSTEPTSTIDYCSTASNICADYLTQIGCEPKYWSINSCQRQGLLQAQNKCACGSLTYPGEEVLKVAISKLLFGRYDMLPYINYPTSEPINFCSAFYSICTRVLDHLNAPSNGRLIDGCKLASDYSTFVGTCTVGNLVLGQYISENIMDAVVVPNAGALLVEYTVNQTSAQLGSRRLSTHYVQEYEQEDMKIASLSILKNHGRLGYTRSLASLSESTHWDSCASYVNYCNFFLTQISCPTTLRVVSACGDVSVAFPYGVPQNSDPVCTCGGIDSLSDYVQDLFTDQMINQQLSNDFAIIPTTDPYTLTVSSSAFGQITRSNPPGPV